MLTNWTGLFHYHWSVPHGCSNGILKAGLSDVNRPQTIAIKITKRCFTLLLQLAQSFLKLRFIVEGVWVDWVLLNAVGLFGYIHFPIAVKRMLHRSLFVSISNKELFFLSKVVMRLSSPPTTTSLSKCHPAMSRIGRRSYALTNPCTSGWTTLKP